MEELWIKMEVLEIKNINIVNIQQFFCMMTGFIINLLWVLIKFYRIKRCTIQLICFKNKIIIMNNPYSHQKKHEVSSRRTLSLVKKDRSDARNIVTAQMGVPCLDQQFLMARKQNYLNTGYNTRRQRLQEITQQNRKIYVKINSQKSAYSRDELRKSYQSNASLSRRLSQSKISNRQSSRSSMRSSKVKKQKIFKPKQKQSYFFQPHSLAHIKISELQNFTKIFKNQNEPQRIKSPKDRKKSISSKSTLHEQSQRQVKVKLPTINSRKTHLKPINVNSSIKIKNSNDGSLLHIIAEQMFGKHKL